MLHRFFTGGHEQEYADNSTPNPDPIKAKSEKPESKQEDESIKNHIPIQAPLPQTPRIVLGGCTE